MQGPAIQGLMGSYLEQSANAFLEMQQQLQKQTRNLFGNFVPVSRNPSRRRRAQTRRQQQVDAKDEAAAKKAAEKQPNREETAPKKQRTAPAAAPQTQRKQAAPRKVGFVSLGCPKALVDSERILTQLRAEGYLVAPTYRGRRPGRRQHLRLHRQRRSRNRSTPSAKRSPKTARVIVTGCLGAKGNVVRDDAPARARGHRPACD